MNNVDYYSKTCSKIGFWMLIFYASFTLSAFFVAIVELAFSKVISDFSSEIIFGLLSAICYFLSFSVAAFFLRRSCRELPNARPIYTSFKFNKWTVFIVLAVIAVNFSVSYLNNSFFTSLFPRISSNLMPSSVSDLAGRKMSELVVLFLIEILSTAIVPAICEEYLFRGAILTDLLPFGKSTAIFASAFLFGMMHQNPMQILYTTLMGVVIGYVYVKTRSIWVCMILHFCNNFITVLEEYLPVFTKATWLIYVLDLLVVAVGAVSILLLLLHKSKEHDPQKDGSFGVVGERGMDVEEMTLELSSKEKIKRFFAVTVIIYTAISIFSMLKILVSFMVI